MVKRPWLISLPKKCVLICAILQALYWNVPVIVEDIQADPLWEPFAELAKKAGVAACWSNPFTSKTGNVLNLAITPTARAIPALT